MSQGHGESQYNLGSCYYRGDGVAPDLDKALECFNKAIEDGYEKETVRDLIEKINEKRKHKMTETEMKSIKLEGYEYELLEGNHEKAIETFRKLNDFDYEPQEDFDINVLGHPLQLIGMAYAFGVGLPVNVTAAKECLRLASNHGDSYAMLLLEDLYVQEQNYAEAKDLCERALKLGNISAYCSLGELYEYGHGVETDYDKAMQYYREAEAKGASGAERHIAAMYFYGHGVERNCKKAFAIYEKNYLQECAENEKKTAEGRTPFYSWARKYAYVLLNGYGCKADPDKALEIIKTIDNTNIRRLAEMIKAR